MYLKWLFFGAAALAAMVASSPASAQPAHNVILVHGALADGAGWMGVYGRLKAKGYNVLVVQEPQTTEEEDVQAVRRAIALQDGPVVLVAHSYGGVLITEAGDEPKVTALVYVAAAVPEVGESVSDLFKITPSPTGDALKPTADGFLMLDPARFRDAFASDLTESQSDFMAHSQVMVSAKAFETKTRVAAWKNKPSYGIVAGRDRTVSPDLERFMYKRANAKIIEIPGASHAVYISHPREVADVIAEAASKP
jgi:pimeloyl-ACP methyl ester carboxylesterase